MFAIQPSPTQSSGTDDNASTNCCTPNILPCRIHYDGPVESLERHWTPKSDEKDGDVHTSHFRGRRLRGRRVAIPEGYKGIIATPTECLLPSSQKNNDLSTDDVVEVEPEEPVKILEQQASFDDFVVWGHEVAPAADDRFVKGVEEWIKLAEAIHSNQAPAEASEKKAST
ncbi:hypothetical protein ASPWEDRAFT_32816 [Aspergillus wentii DTO 134E9]|uniref:Uncharacterized protein n=1 Tax=Aspergillus wentii DTO 134E9 TaxID=1073089 RepID=A0A1L9R6Z7_ASPWE|nr:uncharacterized protein ASPWEDRAFT_32816 [Aspergillus wentii DTO 134E9]OJJ30653.1 hypothetical protein ASPWEDRAFT_32816 [Aspergillus wentii DTO 134E9]